MRSWGSLLLGTSSFGRLFALSAPAPVQTVRAGHSFRSRGRSSSPPTEERGKAPRGGPGRPAVGNVVIIEGVRTAFGRFGGALRDVAATQLGIEVARGALARSTLAPEAVDHVVFGNVIQSSADAVYLARHVGFGAGVRIE